MVALFPKHEDDDMRECVGDNATAHIRRRQTDFYRSDDKNKSVVLYSLLITKTIYCIVVHTLCSGAFFIREDKTHTSTLYIVLPLEIWPMLPLVASELLHLYA